MQPNFDSEKLVFIDESSAKTNMTRLRGRASKGERVHDSAPCGNWNTTTMISSIRSNAETACMVIDGAITTEIFRVYVSEILVPTLRDGDIVIMDNLSSHKCSKTLELIERAGAVPIFLPAYSPDLNPIEKMWSKVKEYLRAAKARTEESLYEAIGNALKSVTVSDAVNWFASCGYSFS
jgi:transposase